jgi:pyruvate/2-oxoglutarate dehydrogenase complex dihydrolipoamide acyltransferase (E2) component
MLGRGRVRGINKNYEPGEMSVMSDRSGSQEESQRPDERKEADNTFGQGAEGRGEEQQRGGGTSEASDIVLEVPQLSLEELRLQVENLRARISIQAELADKVKINVGVDAYVDNVDLELKGLEAQILLKANLDNVRDILSRALESLDSNPAILDSQAQTGSDSAGSLDSMDEYMPDGEPQQTQGGNGGDRGTEEAETGEVNATEAAWRKAQELGMDLSRIEGSGSGGRVLVKDVVGAARQG